VKPDHDLDALAGSVSDGRPVDWSLAESSAEGPERASSIRALRELERIAEFNRRLQDPPGDGDPAPAPANWGPLLLLEPVGSGASGEVWRAWDPELQREVALKFLLDRGRSASEPSEGAALADEARALARIRHPGVVTVYGIDEHDGRPGMWMEFLHGSTLAETIERRGALDAIEVARIGLALCRALEAVEAAGLVHRDLKPANVVVEPDRRVVLTDFGLGRRRSLEDAGWQRTSGTPIFMSPGVLSGRPATPRSDLYALGVTLRWALTGRPPFRARTLEELKQEAGTGPAVPTIRERADAPPALAAAIDRAMAPNPEARFSGPGEMAEVLAAIVENLERPGRGSSRWPWVRIAAAFLIAAVVLVTYRLHARESHPVVPSPVSVATSPVPAGYEIDATLIDRTDGAFRRLTPGDRVSPGDRLSLQFHASRPMWVYVLNQDDRGETYLLFPQPLFDRANPLPADSTAVLPGPIRGRENAWTVTSRGGHENFLIVASPEPVAEIESELGRLPPAEPGRPIRYAAVGPAVVERLRGVGGLSVLPAGSAGEPTGLFDRFQALAGQETVTRGLWARRITLENPLR